MKLVASRSASTPRKAADFPSRVGALLEKAGEYSTEVLSYASLVVVTDFKKTMRFIFMKYEKYKDNAGQWRWRLKAANGEIISASSEAYVAESSCDHSINLNKSSASAPVYRV